jgi:hypothetical protein
MNLMNTEIGQILWYVGFTVLGFFLRHASGGSVLPPPTPVTPSLPGTPLVPPIPADHPLLVNLSQLLSQILKLLPNQPPKT